MSKPEEKQVKKPESVNTESNNSVNNVQVPKEKINPYANLSVNSFNAGIGRQLTQDITDSLQPGSLPEGKYLVQHIASANDPNTYGNFINKLGVNFEVIPVGKGAEYMLTNKGTVNSFDTSKFVPSLVGDIENWTYTDTLSIPKISKGKNTNCIEIPKCFQPYLYFPYFISGKGNELIEKLKSTISVSESSYIFMSIFNNVLKPMYKYITSKDPCTDTSLITSNYVKLNSGSVADSMKCFIDLVTEMTWDNTVFNYGKQDSTGKVEPFTAAYNSSSISDLVFITDKQTLNNIKKYAIFLYQQNNFENFINFSQFIILPGKIADPSNIEGDLNGLCNMVDLKLFYDSEGNYKPGTVLIIKKGDIKCLKNLETITGSYYPENLTSNIKKVMNFSVGTLKWTQCAVFEDPGLQKPIVINTKASN